MDQPVPEARIDLFPGHPAPAAQHPPGKLSEREARVFPWQRSEEAQGRKKILSAEEQDDPCTPYSTLAAFAIAFWIAFIFAAGIFTEIPMISVRPRRSSAWGIAFRL